MNLVRRTDTTRPVVSPSLPLLKRTIHPHVNRHTERIVTGVTVLPQRVARSSRAPSSNTLFLSTFPSDKTQRKQWKSSCQTSTNLPDTCLVIKLTECLLEDAKNQGSTGQYRGASLGRCARWWSALGRSADFRHSGLDAYDSVQETLCSIPSLHSADKIVSLNQRNTKFSVKTCLVLLILRASHLETLTAHSSHHCPKLRENATRKRVTKVEKRKREKKGKREKNV